jgi:hypothetical protein
MIGHYSLIRVCWATLFVLGAVFGVQAQEAEPDMVIVKYGKILVKSTAPDAKVYVDDVYRGRPDSVIDNVIVGDRVISCRTETESVSGTFTVRRDEVLKLEARFNEGRIVGHVEKIEPPAEEAKPKQQAPKPEKPKKPAAAAKKEERKSPEEERRELHLNILKAYFENIENEAVRVTHKVNARVIGKFTEKKDQTGTYYRTKQGLLLCDAGPCERQWSATFVYTDEEGKAEAFGVTWKETIFNGITPQGTSRRDLVYCVSGVCKNFADVTAADVPQQLDLGRYHLTWSKSSLIIRRSDIMKEITAAGGSPDAY